MGKYVSSFTCSLVSPRGIISDRSSGIRDTAITSHSISRLCFNLILPANPKLTESSMSYGDDRREYGGGGRGGGNYYDQSQRFDDDAQGRGGGGSGGRFNQGHGDSGGGPRKSVERGRPKPSRRAHHV